MISIQVPRPRRPHFCSAEPLEQAHHIQGCSTHWEDAETSEHLTTSCSKLKGSFALPPPHPIYLGGGLRWGETGKFTLQDRRRRDSTHSLESSRMQRAFTQYNLVWSSAFLDRKQRWKEHDGVRVTWARGGRTDAARDVPLRVYWPHRPRLPWS